MGSLFGIVRLVVKRSMRNWRLLLASFVGLVIAVSLVAAIPLYTHGTLERLLQTRLTKPDKRPPGTVWVRALLESPDPSAIDQYHRLDEYIVNNVQWIVDVPLQELVRYVATDIYIVWPAGELGNIAQSDRRYGYLAFQQGLENNIKIIEGQGLPDTPTSPDEDVPAIIASVAAEELHLQVGESYIYTDVERYNPSGIPLKIVGIWEPTNPDDEFWVYDPYLFTNAFFISEDSMFSRVLPVMPKALHEVSWYGVFDGTKIHSTNAERVLSGLQFLETRAQLIFPSARLHPTLSQILDEFQRRAFLLNILLFTLTVPMIAVVLYYIATSFGMVIERQRGEIALLKSRGASTAQIIGMYLLEGIILGGLALLTAPLIGQGVAQLIGTAYGFLQFAKRPPLALTINEQTIQYASAAVVLALLASLVPAISAARHSIISYKQEVARSSRMPFWQRFFVDFALLAVAAYGYNMLRQRQSILQLGQNETLVIDPLLLIVPSVFIFACALLFLRIFPLITALFGRLTSLLRNPSVPLALKQIARTPVQYMSLVLLLILTLSLGAYSASAAHTIDQNFTERVLYETPADLELWEAWEYDESTNTYFAPPFQEHYVDGVIEATPFRSFKAAPQIGRNAKDGQLLALQRLDYPSVGWWRKDFADKPLGALMNALGAGDAATLVSRSFLTNYQLKVGDAYTLNVEGKLVEFYVAEVVENFPTLYPEKGDFWVANLDYVFDQVGMQPYRVWLKVDPSKKSADIVDQIRERQIRVVSIKDSRVAVNAGRTDPQRTGLFGALTVGFAVAALLTVLGFFLYSFLSFERRLLQMGILRAMGLSIGQLFGLLIFEQVFLIAIGVIFGTALGVATGSLFIPFLQVGAEGQTPHFVVQTAWTDIQRIYVVLGLMLVAGLASTTVMISRMKLFQVVKMGEEQ